MDFDADMPTFRDLAFTGVPSRLDDSSNMLGRCLIDELETIGEPVSSTVTTLLESIDRPWGADDLEPSL